MGVAFLEACRTRARVAFWRVRATRDAIAGVFARERIDCWAMREGDGGGVSVIVRMSRQGAVILVLDLVSAWNMF